MDAIRDPEKSFFKAPRPPPGVLKVNRKSPAARHNRATLQLLIDCLAKNPEVNLLEIIPTTYTRLLEVHCTTSEFEGSLPLWV